MSEAAGLVLQFSDTFSVLLIYTKCVLVTGLEWMLRFFFSVKKMNDKQRKKDSIMLSFSIEENSKPIRFTRIRIGNTHTQIPQTTGITPSSILLCKMEGK